jgi:hypothetical protein
MASDVGQQKGYQVELYSVMIALLALLFSILSFALSFRQQRKLESDRKRLAEVAMDASRDIAFEGRLSEYPRALELHGVDLDAASADGVTPEQIAYLVVSISALSYYCRGNQTSIYQHLQVSDYRQRMFEQPSTQKAWSYARHCLTRATGSQIDQFLHARYGIELPSLSATGDGD